MCKLKRPLRKKYDRAAIACDAPGAGWLSGA
jgi:hypothetical protein